MTGDGWSVIASEYAERESRLRALLANRAHGKTLEKAVAELLEENRLLYRWNTELRAQIPKPEPKADVPLVLDSSWTTRT